jgi:MFS family permease
VQGRTAARFREAAHACALNLRNPNLRRSQLAFGAIWASEWATMVTLGVVAYRDGGAGAVGLVALLRMLPAALVAPFAATVADRVRREHVLAGVAATRAATLGGAAAVLALGGPVAAVYALAVVATIAHALYRPAQSALLPALCKTPRELTSANIVRGLLDSLATFAGPLLAAVLLSVSGPALAFAACALLALWAAYEVLGLRYEEPPRVAVEEIGIEALLAGLRATWADKPLALVTGLTTVQTFMRGALSVLSVVVAIDLIDTGEAGVGVLNGALGAGAVTGSLIALMYLGHGRLAATFGVGVTLWGLPLAGIAVLPYAGAAIVLLVVVGIGNAFVDIGAFTLPARMVDESVMARVFAAFEGVATLGVAAGAATTPLLIDLLGIQGALAAVGLLGPVAVLASWPALMRLDRRIAVRDADIALLQLVPLLQPLPQATIEQLAASLERAEYPSGATVFAQGDHGDSVYVVEAGAARVIRDGQELSALAYGEVFGEIALLRDSPRTATVRAAEPGGLRVATLSRDRFLTAVTGFCASRSAVEEIVTTRLEEMDRLGTH